MCLCRKMHQKTSRSWINLKCYRDDDGEIKLHFTPNMKAADPKLIITFWNLLSRNSFAAVVQWVGKPSCIHLCSFFVAKDCWASHTVSARSLRNKDPFTFMHLSWLLKECTTGFLNNPLWPTISIPFHHCDFLFKKFRTESMYTNGRVYKTNIFSSVQMIFCTQSASCSRSHERNWLSGSIWALANGWTVFCT